MDELWAEIDGFSRYRVSSFGRIFNVVFDRFMSPSVATPVGHLKISLIDDHGIRRTCSLAVLVAEAFVEPPDERSTDVIVLDGDFNNVAAYNLAWRTHRQAYLYARQMRTKPKVPWTNLPVRNQTTGVEYDNIVQCGIAEGLLFEEIYKSTYEGFRNRETGEYWGTPVYPHGHTYEIFKRV